MVASIFIYHMQVLNMSCDRNYSLMVKHITSKTSPLLVHDKGEYQLENIKV